MIKFKLGDRVRVIPMPEKHKVISLYSYLGREGTIQEESHIPSVLLDGDNHERMPFFQEELEAIDPS